MRRALGRGEDIGGMPIRGSVAERLVRERASCTAKPRYDRPTGEIDALVRDGGGIALPCLDAPGNASAIVDRKRVNVRKSRVACVDAAAFEDHETAA